MGCLPTENVVFTNVKDAAVFHGIRPATGKLRITIIITPLNERGCLRSD